MAEKVGALLVVGGGIERISSEQMLAYYRETPTMTARGGF